ncbi:MAG: outer membrane protein assembly factor BamA [Deltaproteobacteria bacterium]|nr:outer membrane protein assembly factor BamA [Deltaproteobacteria bacterium]
MIKRIFPILCMVAAFALPLSVQAREARKAVVLPFAINAQEDLAYLEDEIPELIKKQLREENARILDPDAGDLSNWRKAGENPDVAARIGKKAGAENVIWGSLTRVGQQFSLDAKLLTLDGGTALKSFYAEGKGIDHLLAAISKLAGDISVSLFGSEKIEAIRIEGNRRIEKDAIMRYIRTKPGDIYVPKDLSDDLKSVYSMGYFEDIRIEYEDGKDGKIIIFKVKEKPTIRRIKFKGNRAYDDEEILDSMNIKSGSILNIFKIQNNIIRIENLYKEKNYHNVKVTYSVEELENNQGDLLFTIEEGKKVKIKEISFEGNTVYTDKQLKKIIKTDEKGFWSFLTRSGELNRDDLRQDVTLLANFYHNNGYIEAKVGAPLVEFRDDMIYIKFKITEGPRFKVGYVGITGDLILPEDQLRERLQITQKTFYSRETIRNDVVAITDIYSDEGYAHADIFPRVDKDLDNLKVDIEFVIKKGKQVYFEAIVIGGNNKTRDKVIRRELQIYEQELFSGSRLKRSMRNLYRLDFFEDVKVDMAEGSSDDKMVLKIDVAEKSTGSFSVGGGYSSVEYAYATASVQQRNLFGRGQDLQLRGQVSGVSQTYVLSFTEPYFLDTHLSTGFDLYNQTRDYSSYDKDSTGGKIRFSFPTWDYTRFYWQYAYDVSTVYNIDEDAANSIQEMRGTNITSSTKVTMKYDSRDKIFNTTEGALNSVSMEYAGIGGDVAYTKYLGESGWYFPMFKGTVAMLHGELGYVHENPGGFLPDYEKFYLGGMNTVRGFKWRDIYAVDDNGDEIGGNYMVQFNAEYQIPLVPEAGVVGVLFVDVGQVYREDQIDNLGPTRESCGGGFRWYSPVGPIRFEYGYILDPKPGETRGRWEFSMGTVF